MRVLPPILKLPPAGRTLAGLLALYILAGLFGHDPWKNEDVIHLALARDFLDSETGIFGFSTVAPLYYWSAALTGQLFGDWLLPLHDAMRLASGLWTALALMAVYYAGRELYGQENASASPLLLAGSFGLLVRAHEAQPMLTLLAAVSFVLLAGSLWARKPRTALALFGAALVTAALGTGLAGLLLLLQILFLFWLLRPILFPRPPSPLPRPARGLMFLVGGVGLFLSSIIVLFALGIWIADAAPPWFSNSLLQQQGGLLPNPSRYFQELRQMLGMLPWFSWPLLPLAGWSLWVRRRQWRQADILWPLFAFVALLFLLLFRFDARETTLIVLLPPLALLATPGALALRRGAANAFDWFSGMAFSVFALLLWLGWSAMIFGWPTRLAQRAVELEPGFVGRFDLFFFGLALAVTLWWVWSLLTLPRSPYRCLTRWSTGLAVVWLLAVSLWLPWIDYGKSYRQLSATVAAHLPEQQMECLAGWHLGEAQRASLAYFERLRLTPLGAAGQTRCRWLLTQGSSRAELTPPGSGWQRVWEGQRPGDRRERFRLYRRGNPP